MRLTFNLIVCLIITYLFIELKADNIESEFFPVTDGQTKWNPFMTRRRFVRSPQNILKTSTPPCRNGTLQNGKDKNGNHKCVLESAAK